MALLLSGTSTSNSVLMSDQIVIVNNIMLFAKDREV